MLHRTLALVDITARCSPLATTGCLVSCGRLKTNLCHWIVSGWRSGFADHVMSGDEASKNDDEEFGTKEVFITLLLGFLHKFFSPVSH